MVGNDVSTSRQWLSVNTCADWLLKKANYRLLTCIIVKSVENYKNGISDDLFVCIGCILIDVVRCSTTSWNFWNISVIFHEIFQGKKIIKFYITSHVPSHAWQKSTLRNTTQWSWQTESLIAVIVGLYTYCVLVTVCSISVARDINTQYWISDFDASLVASVRNRDRS